MVNWWLLQLLQFLSLFVFMMGDADILNTWHLDKEWGYMSPDTVQIKSDLLHFWWKHASCQTSFSTTRTGHLSLRWSDLCCALWFLKMPATSWLPFIQWATVMVLLKTGFLLGPLAIHLWPLSASHTCKCNIDWPWALIASPFNPQPPNLSDGFSKWGRK